MFQPPAKFRGGHVASGSVFLSLSLFPQPLPMLFLVNCPAATIAISLHEVAWSDVDDTKS
ncbi:hypothetical protein N7516_007974 [Penicillium verrucosum]|uniref:uncharacterized protein n=1 Tax=Penicillium verrucosum TaxID=60171 RepID=UPI0025455B36|nr:uncharacterized protein N7516_007974 [Penicillium verrucosum]KAJ5926201.1 hypothetical protein N7516_007974 [Penicillium verrucosum]